ncbi:MAG: ATP-binding cassette domain-containing protein [Methanosarcinales archaeon]|nr:ATP-binding cassette domain-containing protein [Methanosarcinales archaeon]
MPYRGAKRRRWARASEPRFGRERFIIPSFTLFLKYVTINNHFIKGCVTIPIPIIQTKDLVHTYNRGVTALNNVNFSVEKGERVVILGTNGAGKSTLFRHLNGILKPTSGEILIKGERINKKNILDVRRTVGLVFQDPDDQIFAPTVAQDIAFGPMNLGLSADEVEERVSESLKLVGLDGFGERTPHRLSGGEKKRVAIAGILAMKPEVLVLDEPTAGLDPKTSTDILHLISRMNHKLGMTIIMSTHDVDVVPAFAQRVCVMHNGCIEADCTPKEIFSKPELIEKAHLRLPRIAMLLELLKEDGYDLNVELTCDNAKTELVRLLENK